MQFPTYLLQFEVTYGLEAVHNAGKEAALHRATHPHLHSLRMRLWDIPLNKTCTSLGNGKTVGGLRKPTQTYLEQRTVLTASPIEVTIMRT